MDIIYNYHIRVFTRSSVMDNITLYIPKLTDYWYEEKLLTDPETMNYNAGYDVTYEGYHYDTGCIDYSKCKWLASFEKRQKENIFYAYLKVDDTFVGYVNYHFNTSTNRYECGIVIEATKRGMGYAKIGLRLLIDEAKSNGIESLYDSFEEDRGNTLSIFKSLGFEVVKECTWKKFNEDVKGVIIKIVLDQASK